MVNFRTIVITLQLWLLYWDCDSQNLVSSVYDTDAGLPSSEIYRVFPDRSGNLWFCTDRGIAVYNSYSFVRIKGPSANLVFVDGYCDIEGNCWFKTTNGTLFSIVNNKLEEVLNMNYKSITVGSFEFMKMPNSVFIGQYDDFSFNFPARIISIKGTIRDTVSISNFDLVNQKNAKSVKLSVYYDIQCHRALYTINAYNSNCKDSVDFRQNYFNVNINVNSSISNSGLFNRVIGLGRNKVLVAVREAFIIVDVANRTWQRLNLYTQEHGFLNSALLSNNYLYFSTSKKKFERVSLSSKLCEKLNDVEIKTITSSYMDGERNLWVTSLENGVEMRSFLQSNNILVGENVTSVRIADTRLLIGTKAGNVYCYNSISKLSRKIGQSNSEIRTIDTLIGNKIVVHGTVIDLTINTPLIESKADWINFYYRINGSTYLLSPSRILKLLPNSNTMQTVLNMKQKIFSSIQVGNKIVFATDSKLFEFSPETHNVKLLLSVGFRITSFFKFHEKYVLTTLGFGVYIYNYNLNKLEHNISINNGLSSNTAYASISTDTDVLWIATNNGLNKIQFAKLFNSFRVVTFDKSNGLPSNEIYCMDYSSEILYIGTSKGLGMLNLQNLVVPDYKPVVNFTYFNIISDNAQQESLKSKFLYNENNIRIDFSAFVVSKSIISKTYRYALLSDHFNDTQWFSTDQTTLQFTNLEPGKYVFLVKAESRFGGLGPISFYKFEIIPHFSQTLWFKFIVVLGILGVISLFFFMRLQSLRNSAKFQSAVKVAQLDSLRNQMNPHFIFNALNAVQSLIYDNKHEDAGVFLGKISRMFRDALEFSRSTTISLKVEILFIGRYLEIEGFRFPNKLQYRILIDPEVEEDLDNILIPPLLMQPLVENSVKHGLKNIDGIGVVVISIAKIGNSIEYFVEDFCGGIVEKGSSTHTSRGLSIIRQRIDILNQLYPSNNKYKFDFINTPEKGVKAILTIPID